MSNPTINAITLGTLAAVCARVHGVPDTRRPTILGRFRNLQKVGFPKVEKVGTGQRAAYWPEHVAQALVAFELLRFRLPQSPVAFAVARHRDVVSDAFARASAGTAPVILRVLSNALLDDASSTTPSDLRLEIVEAVGAGRGQTSTAGANAAAEVTAMTIDVAALAAAAAAASRFTDEPFDLRFFAKA